VDSRSQTVGSLRRLHVFSFCCSLEPRPMFNGKTVQVGAWEDAYRLGQDLLSGVSAGNVVED
jgi:hypothetical protein